MPNARVLRPALRFSPVQNNLTDPLAAEMVPKLLAVLGSAHLTSSERSVVSSVRSWDYSTGSAWRSRTRRATLKPDPL